VGGSQARAVDTRVIAASCRDPAAGVRAGTFRADLYHRLALLRCELPPLRSRPRDLQALVAHFLRQLRVRYRRPALALTPGAERLLLSHPWPGNVRELAHALEAAVILSGDALLSPEHFARVLVEVGGAAAGEPPASGEGTPRSSTHAPDAEPGRAGTPERYSFFGSERDEREAIRRALVRCKGNRTRAARELGMARNTLRQRIRRLRLEPGPSHEGAETFPSREA
jgi:two-component system response regulator AtoC